MRKHEKPLVQTNDNITPCRCCLWVLSFDARILRSLLWFGGQCHANALYFGLLLHQFEVIFDCIFVPFLFVLVGLDVFCNIAAPRRTGVWEYDAAPYGRLGSFIGLVLRRTKEKALIQWRTFMQRYHDSKQQNYFPEWIIANQKTFSKLSFNENLKNYLLLLRIPIIMK